MSSSPLCHQACNSSTGASAHPLLIAFCNGYASSPPLQTDCVFIMKSDGKWRDDSCDNKRGYVCQMDSREFCSTQPPKEKGCPG